MPYFSQDCSPHQDSRVGPSWVLMVLLNLVEEWLIFTSKWTTIWHHGVRGTSLTTHLQSLATQSLWKRHDPHWRRLLGMMVLTFQDHRPKDWLKNSSASPYNGPQHGTTALETPH